MKKYSIRTNWTKKEIETLFHTGLFELLQRATIIHQHFFPKPQLQQSSLLNLKIGNCPEDCAYCAQSSHAKTKIKDANLTSLTKVVADAKRATQNGITRLCMGSSGRSPLPQDFPKILTMIKIVKQMGLETCVTLGMLNQNQVKQLKTAGLDYYNHNLDTSPEYYQKIITTRTYKERLKTLALLRRAKIKICCGGIIGMGESQNDRIKLLHILATFPEHPQCIPLNRFVAIKGTNLANIAPLDNFEFLRTIAITRILMPKSVIRLAAGRKNMGEELQTLGFLVGVNSIFSGDKLLTVGNSSTKNDQDLLKKLGFRNNLK